MFDLDQRIKRLTTDYPRGVASGLFALLLLFGVMALVFGGTFERVFNITGSVASVCGIAYAIVQLWETKRSTEAALDATKAAVSELRRRYYKNSLQNASYLLLNIKQCVDLKEWRIVTIKADDLALCLAQLGQTGPSPDSQWLECSKNMREWSLVFGEGKVNKKHEYDKAKWKEDCVFIQTRIDTETEPFT